MNCDEVRDLLTPLLDNELPQHEAEVVQAHLLDCSGCRSEFEEIKGLHETLVSAGRFNAPGSLFGKITEQLDSYTDSHHSRQKRARWVWPLASHSAAAIFGATTVVIFSSMLSNLVLFDDDMVAVHVKSLASSALIQVKSSDKHTIKPWFAGKVDFAPTVIDLGEQGFPLIGGRVELLNDRKIAALVYKRRKHIVNLFIDVKTFHENVEHRNWDKNGYSVVSAEQRDFIYWAVSDIPADELNEFLSLIISGAG